MRNLDYIDARLIARAIARWRVVGDLSDEQLQENSAAARYLNRRIAEQTEEFVPDAIAAIKALGAEPKASVAEDDVEALRRALGNMLALTTGGWSQAAIDATIADARKALARFPATAPRD